MANTIETASFGLLDDEQKIKVTDFFNNRQKTDHEAETNRIAIEFATKKKNRPNSSILGFNAKQLLKIDPAIFTYLSHAKKEALKEDLRLAYYALASNYHVHVAEDRKQHLALYRSQLAHCAWLYDYLENPKATGLPAHHTHQEVTLKQLIDDLICKLRHISTGKSVYLVKWMSDINVWRLYWVWAGNLVRTVLALFPDNFYRKNQAQYATTAPQAFFGYMSWILYYARFLVHLCLLFKHTIAGPWMSQDEKDMGWQQRLKQQWQERKFKLLNDSIWATVNLMTFFWLVGNGFLGYLGNIITVGLLLGDMTLTRWRHVETFDGIEQDIKTYTDEMARFDIKIRQETDLEKKEILKAQKARLVYFLKQYEFEAAHRKRAANADMVYALGILGSFVVLTGFMLPATLMGSCSAMAFGIAGGVLCFVSNLIYSSYTAYIEVSKCQDYRYQRLLEIEAILNTSGIIQSEDHARFQQLRYEAEYYRQMESYQYYSFLRSAVIETFFPLAIFATFTFLPFGVGIIACAIGAIVAAVLHIYIESKRPEDLGRAAIGRELDVGPELTQTMLQNEVQPAIQKLTPSSWISGFFHTKAESPEVLRNLHLACGT